MEAAATSIGHAGQDSRPAWATGPAPLSRREALARERAASAAVQEADTRPVPRVRAPGEALRTAPFWPSLAVPAPRRAPDDEAPRRVQDDDPARASVPVPRSRREALAQERAAAPSGPPPTSSGRPPASPRIPSRREALARERSARPSRSRRRRQDRHQGRLLTAGAVAAVAFLSAQAHQHVLRTGLPVATDPRDALRHAVLVAALALVVTVLRAELVAARRGPWSHAVPWLVCLVPVLTLVAAGVRGSLDVPLTAALVASQPGVAALAVLLVAPRLGGLRSTRWTRTSAGVTAAGALLGPVLALRVDGDVAQAAAGEGLVVQAAVTGMLVGAALLATAHVAPRRRVVATTALPYRPARPHRAWLRPLVPTGPTLALALAPTLLTDPAALPKSQLWNVALVPGSGIAAAVAAVLGSHALLLVREQWRRRRGEPESPPQAWTPAELAALREEGGWWAGERVTAERRTRRG